MRASCRTCSKNLDGLCSIYCDEVMEEIENCPYYKPLVADYSLEDHLEYDMELVDEEFEVMYE